MHDIVLDEFDRHMNGDASPAFYRHLDNCAECRQELAAIGEITELMSVLKSVEVAAPAVPPGFYNRVAGQIIDQRRNQAWGLFSPGLPFFRRIAFASLLLLAGLGTFLVSREAAEGGADGAAIIAQHDDSGSSEHHADRERLLVTLASYGQ
jgi:hypothetical protein